jgi:hypothetical protein
VTRFRWATVCRALDLLNSSLSNAEFGRLFEEYGLGQELDASGGHGLTTPKLHTLLLAFLRREPDRRDYEGKLVVEGIVSEAAKHVPDKPEPALWSTHILEEPRHVINFRNSLAVDGWTVKGRLLVPVTPSPIEMQRSRLRAYLEAPVFDDARNRLDQLEAALDEGNWEAANGITRGFLAALFVAICQQVEESKQPQCDLPLRSRVSAAVRSA